MRSTPRTLLPPPTTIVPLVLVAGVFALLPLLIRSRVDWWQGWAYAVVTFGSAIGSRLLLLRYNPDLAAERARSTTAENVAPWDKALASLVAVVGPIIAAIVAGLDARYDWSPPLPAVLLPVGYALFLAGNVIGVRAMLDNPFFSGVVRIQSERGHQVVSSGLYGVVRHPGYAGALLGWLGLPLLTETLTTYAPALAVIGGLIVRTILEERTLREELPGYAAYMQRVRYRLLPGIW